jgi:divalent metal cation (Fe/Co/Zn/Cd) transporter
MIQIDCNLYYVSIYADIEAQLVVVKVTTGYVVNNILLSADDVNALVDVLKQAATQITKK